MHGYQPHATRVGRVEAHHQARPARRGDRTGPLVEAPPEVQRHGCIGLEHAAAHAGDHAVGEVGVRVGRGRRGRQFHTAGSAADDGVDHGADDGQRGGPAGCGVERDDWAGHRSGQRLDGRTVDERRRPADVCVAGAALRLLAHLERGDDATVGDQPHTFDGGQAQPAHAGTDAILHGAAADGDEPAQRVLHRDRQCFRNDISGQRHTRVNFPAVRRAATGLQASGQTLVVLRQVAASGSPHDHVAVGPRGLE
ncbi:unannotated protein [freshwater metagenome]|uniref:Unannotated protein n=1 Tax=freshwater metagenome TaxID=449393 RepID=A0A6J7QUH8_9ZZZZ